MSKSPLTKMDVNKYISTGVFPLTAQPQASEVAKTKRGTIFPQVPAGRVERMQPGARSSSSVSEQV